jgi:hypothetical protein
LALNSVAAWSAWMSRSPAVIHDMPIPGLSGSGIGDQCATSAGSRKTGLVPGLLNPPFW